MFYQRLKFGSARTFIESSGNFKVVFCNKSATPFNVRQSPRGWGEQKQA